MNPNKIEKPPFPGCVEMLPPLYPTIQFLGGDKSWSFSRKKFLLTALTENPEHRARKTLPPDLLKIYFTGAEITLKGWQLKKVAEALASGHLIRVHAEKLPGNLVLDEPWVSEIQVRNHSFCSPPRP
jgi:hypothetical protein